MSTTWWKSKFPSLSIADAGKQVALKVIQPPETSALSLLQHTAELPFLCKVFYSLLKSIKFNNHFFSVQEKIAVQVFALGM